MMKQRMKRKGLAAAIAAASLAAFALAGCGGGGGGNDSSSPAPANSPFAGNYVGTFSDPTNNQSANVTATIAANGAISGSTHDIGDNGGGPFTGSVDNSGNGVITVVNAKGTFTDKGTLAFASNGHLTGNLTEYNGNTQVGSGMFDLTKQ